MWLVVDRATAEAWNKGVLDDTAPGAAAGSKDAADKAAQLAAENAPKLGEEDLEDIPAAPVRGVLHAYMAAPELMRVLRRACCAGVKILRRLPIGFLTDFLEACLYDFLIICLK